MVFLATDAVAFAVAEEKDGAVLEYLGNLIFPLYDWKGVDFNVYACMNGEVVAVGGG